MGRHQLCKLTLAGSNPAASTINPWRSWTARLPPKQKVSGSSPLGLTIFTADGRADIASAF